MLFLRAADGKIPFMRQCCDPISAVKAFGKLIVGLHPDGGPSVRRHGFVDKFLVRPLSWENATAPCREARSAPLPG
jgi:hypothetical protein